MKNEEEKKKKTNLQWKQVKTCQGGERETRG